jgi:hypothetical protein
VTLHSYDVVFDIPGEELDPIHGEMHAAIETGSAVSLSIVVVTADAKMEPPLSTLLQTGEELQGDARITLHGVEETSEAEITTTAALRIHFANWADPED